MMKKIFPPLLLVVFSVLPLSAQEKHALPALSSVEGSATEGPLELTWADCVRQALLTNGGLKAKKLAIEQSEYSYLASYNSVLPRVSVSHSLSRSGSASSSPSNRLSFGVSASETLFDLGTFSSIRTSRISYEKASSDYRTESAALRQGLYSAFTSLIVAQEQVSVNRKILALREENAKLIQLKYESGRESRGNMLYAAALHERSRADLQNSERSLDMARRTLVKNLGLPGGPPVSAKGGLEVPQYSLKAGDLNVDNIPRIVSQRKNIETYEERLLSAKSDIWPTLSASQSMSWSGVSEFPGNRSWSMGLSLSLPLFSSGLTYYPNTVKAARVALQSAEETLKDLKLTLENDISSAYDDFLNSRDTALSNLSVLKANEERYQESQVKYMAGKISFIDLENVEQSMVDAQQNQLQYLRNANNKRSSLENLLGVGLEESK